MNEKRIDELCREATETRKRMDLTPEQKAKRIEEIEAELKAGGAQNRRITGNGSMGGPPKHP